MNDIQMHQKELETKLWAMANNLRGTMEAYEFKNYILGMIFYYYLSKREEDYMVNLLKDDGITFEEAWEDEEYKEAVIEEALRDLGYLIEPQYLFRNMVRMVENNNFDIEFLQAAINSIMESTMGADSQEDFENLFDDMQLDSTKLGRTVKDRSAVMGRIIATLADIGIDMENTKIDVLGNAYEYLIGQFAATAGKKAGEFYTPAGPAELLCRLACDGLTDVKEACDPTCGSGSLLLRLQNYANVRMFYGQELTAQTYNLARMNMILRGVPYRNFQIFNGDTLVNDNFEGHKFRVQVANPPYSAKLANPTAMADDPRYNEYGKLAPASKADFAFVQHMVYHMDDDGRIAVLLPHGVLFRGGAEETIRRYMIEKLNVIDAIIGLPANLFFGTGIPVCVLVLRKDRNANSDNILFIDASKDFEPGKNQNQLKEEHINRIVETYTNRAEIDGYSHRATFSEIIENGWNLNIPRYVDSSEKEAEIDIDGVMVEIADLRKQSEELEIRMKAYLKELGL
jgi:type I restriction enzyme M protein